MSAAQVAVVVPTTLLARQHFRTFSARFEGLPIKIAQLSRMVTGKEAAEVRKGLAEGSVNIVIGTHALLSKSVAFDNLGLVIVDEEQHFGVAHKEKLKSLKADVHVLTLSATPIPRTLQLALTGVREMSLIAFGYASDETPELMPLPIWLAHRLAEKLTEVRKNGTVPYLRPDGKTQVTIEYVDGKPARLDTVVVSSQHADDIDLDTLLKPDIEEHVVRPVLATLSIDTSDYRLLVNPTGRFVIGGPMGDAGLTGRKIIVDTYGGMARHGGGAFSGKDPSKVDRSAAYAMRWVAKNVVAAGLASRCEVQVAYAIGKAEPVGLFIETFGTETVDSDKIADAIGQVFDLRPAAIIRDLDLKRPIYAQTAAYGHFGRELPDFTWERTDRAEELKKLATS